MNYELNDNDYIKILEYYKLNIPKSKRLLKKTAENIISKKLCSCIKKVEPINEAKSIGVCTRAVLNRKGLTRGKFTCKKKGTIYLTKIKKNLTIGKNRKNEKNEKNGKNGKKSNTRKNNK